MGVGERSVHRGEHGQRSYANLAPQLKLIEIPHDHLSCALQGWTPELRLNILILRPLKFRSELLTFDLSDVAFFPRKAEPDSTRPT